MFSTTLKSPLGHECLGFAPSLVPKKGRDRVKTNRRDAVKASPTVRAASSQSVWCADERIVGMRDLSAPVRQ